MQIGWSACWVIVNASHTVHKLSQQRLTTDLLAPWESDCPRTCSKISSDWLPSDMKATRPILEIHKMAGYFQPAPYFQYMTQQISRDIPKRKKQQLSALLQVIFKTYFL